MCTVSWVHNENGYQLLCNRDEKRTRLPATPPTIQNLDGVLYLAPTDGAFGGSWIAVNEFGVTLALLNRHVASLSGTTSRGQLIRTFGASRSVDEVRQKAQRVDFSSFAGFTLATLEVGKRCSLFEWDGRNLVSSQDAEHRMPLTSSSFDPDGVEEMRLQEFSSRARAAGRVDANLLLTFHQSHGLGTEAPSAYSTCMHRPDAHTVSFTQIDVSHTEVSFFYSSAAPCVPAPGETLRLARKVSALVPCG